MDSDALFGISDFEGVFSRPIPIHAVLGDSNGALFGQGCLSSGMAKATYGTGSSVMLHVGENQFDLMNYPHQSLGAEMEMLSMSWKAILTILVP